MLVMANQHHRPSVLLEAGSERLDADKVQVGRYLICTTIRTYHKAGQGPLLQGCILAVFWLDFLIILPG